MERLRRYPCRAGAQVESRLNSVYLRQLDEWADRSKYEGHMLFWNRRNVAPVVCLDCGKSWTRGMYQHSQEPASHFVLGRCDGPISELFQTIAATRVRRKERYLRRHGDAPTGPALAGASAN